MMSLPLRGRWAWRIFTSKIFTYPTKLKENTFQPFLKGEHLSGEKEYWCVNAS